MSYTIYPEKCPNCGNPRGHMNFRNNTGEYWFNCFLCGYRNAKNLIPEYWELKKSVLTGDKVEDEKWYVREENIPVGAAEIWHDNGLGSYNTLNSEDECEAFKSSFTLRFNDPKGGIIPGDKNTLKEFRDNKFYVTNLETMTTKEYLPEDYFKEIGEEMEEEMENI